MKPIDFKNAIKEVMEQHELERRERYELKRGHLLEAWKVKKDRNLLWELSEETDIKYVSIWVLIKEIRSATVLKDIITMMVMQGQDAEQDE